MKCRPIIFDGESVRAILAGTKTQTRWVVKPQPLILDSGGAWYPEGKHPKARHYANGEHLRSGLPLDFALYQPGDQLWVRETWGVVDKTPGFSDPRKHPFLLAKDSPDGRPCALVYRASSPNWSWTDGQWKSAKNMPRWASRITLEVVSVRVQRVQEISGTDCIEEGCEPGQHYLDDWLGDGVEPLCDACGDDGVVDMQEYENDYINEDPGLVACPECASARVWQRLGSAKMVFRDRWDAMNARRGYGWDTNPWVWAVEFGRVDDGNA